MSNLLSFSLISYYYRVIIMSIQLYPLDPCLANMVKKMTAIRKWIQYVIVW
jgi:hypothetical protein